ncbi:MAG: GSCFA domain-containing protein [Bacteroidales bacterium]|nr:GSCFA domain-containing protein [Bacteroidales bacterium]
MNFRTEVPLPKSALKIDFQDKILSLGSCFASNIADKLSSQKFSVCNNPFGVLFNPVSIKNNIQLLINNIIEPDFKIFEYNNLWHSWFFHENFSTNTQSEIETKIQDTITSVGSYLKEAKILIITFGTAYTYSLKNEDFVVSNCHKAPTAWFKKDRLTITEIIDFYNDIILKIQDYNPEIEIIFTVSPIRHWADGAHENQLSKSILLLAIDEIIKQNAKTHYFPAYEIVLDELRDYRFYAEDMLHPNNVSINYIWELFSKSYFSEKTQKALISIEKINKSILHKPFFPTSDAYKKHIAATVEHCKQAQKDFGIDYQKEIELLKKI